MKQHYKRSRVVVLYSESFSHLTVSDGSYFEIQASQETSVHLHIHVMSASAYNVLHVYCMNDINLLATFLGTHV